MNIDLEEFKQYLEKIEELTYVNQLTGKKQSYSTQIVKIIQRLSDPDNYNRLSII